MASKAFTAKVIINKFSAKGDLEQIEADNPRTDGIKPTWFELEKVEQKCGKLSEGQKLTLSLSAD